MIQVGSAVADFTASATGEKTITLSALRGKNIVLYFYPKDNTPGCTTEGQDFRDLKSSFDELNCIILGVSRDSLKTHQNFINKHQFNFDLVSDPDESLCKHFDVIKEKNMYGRKYMGIERSTFLIDSEGILREEWRKVKVKGHAQAVLEAAESIA